MAVVIISKHPKGFWQADYWADPDTTTSQTDDWGAPDGFLTGKKRGRKRDVVKVAIESWPDAQILDGVME